LMRSSRVRNSFTCERSGTHVVRMQSLLRD
jgi:hypothetical protein